MDLKDKTKEELLIELEKLQVEHKRLKRSLETELQDLKKTEEALRKSEDNLYITLYSIGDAVISTDKIGLVVRMNPVAEKLCGWPLDEALGKPLSDIFNIVNAETRQPVSNPVKKVLELGEIVGLANHTLLLSRNGDEYHISDSAAPIKNKKGEITGIVLVFSDVTEHYQAQLLIKKNEERYNNLLSNLEAGIVVHAPDTSIILNNHRASELLGLSEEQMRGRVAIDPAWSFVDEDSNPLPLSEYPVNQILSSRNPIQNKLFGVHHPLQKKIVWVSVNGFPELDQRGEIVEIVISFIDITDTKNAEKEIKHREQALRRQNELFDSLIENLPMGVFMVDVPSGKPLVANKTAMRLLGRGILPSATKHNLADVYHAFKKDTGHPYPIDEMPIVKGMKGEASQIDDMIVRRPDGTETMLEIFGSPVKDEEGNVWASLVSFLDITQRKQLEESLRDVEELFTLIMKYTPVYTFIKEVSAKESRVLITSDNYVEMVGVPAQEMKGKTMHDLFPAELATKMTQDDIAVVTNNKAIQIDECLENKFYSTIKFPINRNGKTLLAGYTIDITDRKQLEAELLNAKEKAEESDRLKSAFLANMSHEIRTPMNGILGFAEILQDPDISGEKQQEYLKIIQKSGSRMLNIINDIIDISKIESGLMKVKLSESNINEQIEYIHTFFKPEAAAKNLNLSFKTSLPTSKALLTTDREKLYAILTNLVKNAIKFTTEGSIEFGYALAKDSGFLQFYVKDTGIGIPEERQEAIFERFIQSDISDNMARQGAGLGLAITKSFVEMLGGKIWVESEVGVGSTFNFTLPFNLVQELTEEEKAQLLLDEMQNLTRKLNILIAEDDETSVLLLSIVVNEYCNQVLFASTGNEAVEICRNNPNLDLILIDIRMPELNGYEATRQIRAFNKQVVIIAQTAYGLSADREKAIETGCNDFISKPINKNSLLALLQKYFKQETNP